MRDKQPRPSVRRDPDKGGVGVMACVFSPVFLVCGILFALWFSNEGPIVVCVYEFAAISIAIFLLSGGVFLLGLGFGRITLLEGGVLESRILLWKKTIRVSDVEGVCKATGHTEGEMFVLMGPRVSEAGVHTEWWYFPTSGKGEAFLREFWHGEVTKGGKAVTASNKPEGAERRNMETMLLVTSRAGCVVISGIPWPAVFLI